MIVEGGGVYGGDKNSGVRERGEEGERRGGGKEVELLLGNRSASGVKMVANSVLMKHNIANAQIVLYEFENRRESGRDGSTVASSIKCGDFGSLSSSSPSG